MLRMEYKALGRLKALQKLNSDRNWVNRDIYRMMYMGDLYIVAYERIKCNPGNMTPGSDGETLDGFSTEWIHGIIGDLRTEQFQFKPVREKFIDKPGKPGKKRRLGIPSTKDKLVQEVMRMILEAIYDSPEGPYFLDTSHGFRQGRSCHTALREFRGKWSATNWFIEGDIKSCFDDIDHHVLIHLLRRKIQDERFLNLVWKLLKAGYMDELRERHDSLAGTPQGGIVSPILANVVLHELDAKVDEIRRREEKGVERDRKRPNPEYMELFNQRRRIVRRNGGKETDESMELKRRMREIPSVLTDDPDFIRIRYLRYADDWIVGVCGPRSLAESIKDEMKNFLRDELHLTLSDEKTHITHAKQGEARFLGTLFTIGWGDKGATKVITHASRGSTVTRRVTGSQPVIKAPLQKLVQRLASHGFCDPEGYPTHRAAWTNLDDDQIIVKFGAINRGILNYYRPVDNFSRLNRIQYILQFSCAKTLANKHRMSVKATFTKYGDDLTVVKKSAKGKEIRISFGKNTDWKRKPNAFAVSNEHVDRVRMNEKLRSRSRLGAACVICGTSKAVVMHHVRHVRKMGVKAKGFTVVMNALNRKQVPVCRQHHLDIHAGRYDGIRLSDLAYDPRKPQ